MTKKQQTFINQYYKHRNATRSAIEAGYSSKTANRIGYSLLKKPSVRKAIVEKLASVGQEL